MRGLITGRVMLPIAALAVTVSVVAFYGVGDSLAQERPKAASTPSGDLEVLQIRPDFYMIAGAGGNVAVQVGSDGVVLVDTGSAAAADSVVAAVRRNRISRNALSGVPPEDDGGFGPLNHGMIRLARVDDPIS